MPKIEISDEVYRRLRAFVKVIDAVLEEKLSDRIDEYAELVLSIGLERMLQDPLPKEEMLLKTMVEMFKENPEFVSNFIAEKLKAGKRMLEEEEKIKKAKESWKQYIA